MTDTMTVNINLGNASFAGESERPGEIERILRDIARKVSGGFISGPVFDSNGNKVGKWAYDPYEEEDE